MVLTFFVDVAVPVRVKHQSVQTSCTNASSGFFSFIPYAAVSDSSDHRRFVDRENIGPYVNR